MSRPARSLFYFAIYILVTGVAFIAAPEFLSSILQLPPATAGWARVVGLLALVIGAYDLAGSHAECMPYIRASVPVRFGFAAGTLLLVVFGQMPATILLLGATDVAGALWTAFALKANTSAAAAA
ncbi:MAG TPA: hypothetical protein VLV78_14760 [Thermoanaerobaculia bacterium]|nr:hypothetical protein [Thermoanaerobaculia bacterium]